jgi:hypothetical protein
MCCCIIETNPIPNIWLLGKNIMATFLWSYNYHENKIRKQNKRPQE